MCLRRAHIKGDKKKDIVKKEKKKREDMEKKVKKKKSKKSSTYARWNEESRQEGFRELKGWRREKGGSNAGN